MRARDAPVAWQHTFSVRAPAGLARAAPLFAFPSLDDAPRARRTGADAAGDNVAGSTGRTTVVRPPTPSTPVREMVCAARAPNSPLDALGGAARATLDEIGHMKAAIQAHMPPSMMRLVGLPDSLRTLDVTVAKDMRRAMHDAFANGVRHGEWLKEGEARRSARDGGGTELRAQLAQLQLAHAMLQNDYALALGRLHELTSDAPLVVAVETNDVTNDETNYDADLHDLEMIVDDLGVVEALGIVGDLDAELGFMSP
jgi:hypothetical protein